MDVIEIKTLIDVTDTQVVRINQGTLLEIEQYKNFNTLRQCLEMRSIILYDKSPTVESVNVDALNFGSEYSGTHKIWTFTFSPDRPGVYSTDKDIIGLLIDDIYAVPVILNLTETINTHRAMFDTKDSRYKNTIIQALPGIDQAI